MYEPVSDSCVTIVGPRHSMGTQQHQQHEQSDADDESAPNTISSIPIDDTKDQRSPRRLPRRKKNRAPSINQHNTADCPVYKNHKIIDEMRTGNGDKCIDIDQITLERNYKNKKLHVSTQTSQVVPYRLKFWPKITSTTKCTGDAKAIERMTCCCRTFSQWCLSQIGLTIILFCWALFGALAFYQTEGK